MTTATKTPTPISLRKESSLASTERMKSLSEMLHRRIAQRAYLFFEKDGKIDGLDLAHWLQAETSILKLKPEIQDSPGSVLVTARVPNTDPRDVEVCVGAHEAIIRASTEHLSEAANSGKPQTDQEEVFFRAQWPWEVDPSTASAYLKDRVLTIVAKKTSAPSSSVS